MPEDKDYPLSLLTPEQFEKLDELIEDLATSSEDADIFVLLGYLSAQALVTQPLSLAEWFAELFEQVQPNQEVTELINLALAKAKQGFYQGCGIELPFNLHLDEEDVIADWCAGFMQAVFAQEDVWHSKDEQELAELLVPIMALSGLFNDEEEFAAIEEDNQLKQQFIKFLPSLLLDIYCQIHAPAEKPRKA